MAKPSGLFPIGDVAKMFRVSVSSLRHYEALGLLTPEYVNEESGYRYYGPRQFEVLNTVRCLRALDMPISEIADFLANRDIDSIETKLRQQKAAVEQKLSELSLIERKLDDRLARIEDARSSELDRISLRSFPASRLLLLESDLRLKEYLDMETPIRNLVTSNAGIDIYLGKVGVGISAERLLNGTYDRYDCIFLILDDADIYDGPVLELPEERCAVIRFRGSHAEAPAQYEKLSQFIGQQGLTATGFSREITLIDYGITNDTKKFVTEIRIPVTTS